MSAFDFRRRLIHRLSMTSSQTLITEYVRTGSDSAFRELVTRYLGLVYGTALRYVRGDTYLAEDVAQMVFIRLARKAPRLLGPVMLGGWLHRVTCHVAATLLRGERRRQSRERQAVAMNTLEDHTEANLACLLPILDQAINQMGQADRTAILLRFYEQCDFGAVGERLGTTEEAARKRVSRALDKLQVLLKRRGLTVSAAALGAVLAQEALAAAPAGLAVSIASTALSQAAMGTGIALTLSKIMIMTKLKAGIVGAIVVAGVTTPLVVHRANQLKLREQGEAMRQQANRLTQLTAANEQLSNWLAQARSDQGMASNQLLELMRLRNEVARLRSQSNEIQRLRSQTPPLRAGSETPQTRSGDRLPRESWTFAGYDTPEATMQSIFWATAKRDTNVLVAAFPAEAIAQLEAKRGGLRELIGMYDQFTAFRIVNTLEVSGYDSPMKSLIVDYESGTNHVLKRVGLRQDTSGWKWVGWNDVR